MSNLVSFGGNVVIIGFGSLGPGVLPLLLRHFNLDASRVTIITAEERGRDVANKYGVKFVIDPLTPDNYRDILTPLLKKGDFLLNVSVDVSSVALVELAWELGAFYLDTCIEPWAGGYTDPNLSPSERSNYALRDTALKLKAAGKRPTAIMTCGANPGLVSFFTKKALLDIARDTGINTPPPVDRRGWAELAEKLGVKTIHIAERDTQVAAKKPKQVDEFVNTWSIDGFVGEGCQPAELGWGSHERHFPADGRRHQFGSDCAIYLLRPGASTQVRTWTPTEGPFHGYLITHSESISIADYFTVKSGDTVRYRPTVHYAYHPCDDAVLSVHELAGKTWQQQSRQRLLMDEITSGVDELGVLLMGHAKGAYWYGSQLSITEARELCPHNNATSMQVTATILAGMVWALENPDRGMVEPDEMDFDRCLQVAMPYLGKVVGVYTGWTPLEKRGELFPEDIDEDDPWQFKNFRVV
ncbi:saccharopine dehydrogenase C-terminal domain-containing protein [Magnetospirillum sp. 64-120]|uniref:homospermidine synthase n=1 Tax=Magnetospirillum sp. 64-120 TaxID=1895778 RepID=UPI000925C9DD|nr:saccharopine dehydrogenase C-terminal domain-containing protein [Magnetospirillum sp. 64-120]OJX72179.1 MAG: homospermidine synthase [Magnetospirillum sp. 64-120]